MLSQTLGPERPLTGALPANISQKPWLGPVPYLRKSELVGLIIVILLHEMDQVLAALERAPDALQAIFPYWDAAQGFHSPQMGHQNKDTPMERLISAEELDKLLWINFLNLSVRFPPYKIVLVDQFQSSALMTFAFKLSKSR